MEKPAHKKVGVPRTVRPATGSKVVTKENSAEKVPLKKPGLPGFKRGDKKIADKVDDEA